MNTRAEFWLANYLRDGKPHDIKLLLTKAKKENIRKSEIREAKKSLGVETTDNRSHRQGRAANQWLWTLPRGG